MSNTMNTYTHMDLPCRLATNKNHPVMAACALILFHWPLGDGDFSLLGLQTWALVAIRRLFLKT